MKQRIRLGKIRFLSSMQHHLTKGIKFETQGFTSLPKSMIKVSSRHQLEQEQLHFNSSILLAYSLKSHDFTLYTKLKM